VTPPSHIQFFKFFQKTNYSCSQDAGLRLSRIGLSVSLWKNTNVTKLIKLMTSTVKFRECLRQCRSGAMCLNRRYYITLIPADAILKYVGCPRENYVAVSSHSTLQLSARAGLHPQNHPSDQGEYVTAFGTFSFQL